MKCTDCKHQLLLALDPARPAPAVLAHLASCDSCRTWRVRLLTIENNVPRVPVPASTGKSRLLERLLRDDSATPAAERNKRSTVPQSQSSQRAEATTSTTLPFATPARVPWQQWTRRQRWLAAGSSVAAAVALIMVGVWLGNLLWPIPGAPGPVVQQVAPPAPAQDPAAAPSSLVARVLECDLDLARTTDRQERVEALSRLAALLLAEARPLVGAGGAEELTQLAELYRRVLEKGVVVRAQDLPRAKRVATLGPIARDLDRQRDEMNALVKDAAPALTASLRQMANMTQTGASQLRALMEEATP